MPICITTQNRLSTTPLRISSRYPTKTRSFRPSSPAAFLEPILKPHKTAPERIIPSLRVYKEYHEKENRHQDIRLIAVWRGIGGTTPFAKHRRSPMFHKIVLLATERSLPLLMHTDPIVIDTLYEYAPRPLPSG